MSHLPDHPDAPGAVQLQSPSQQLVLLPVRHHSPACARMVRETARAIRPKAILIEGPADYNDQLGQLFLDHRLPIAIYSYAQLQDGNRRGAFYPFCVHSPEWQALQIAAELGIQARFIDLPWAFIAAYDQVAHRYADGELRRSPYIPTLCERAGVEDFDALWDVLVEIDARLSSEQLCERIASLCANIRTATPVPPQDMRREDFMAEQIRAAMQSAGLPLLVVTGGYHTAGLAERLGIVEQKSQALQDWELQVLGSPSLQNVAGETAIQSHGIALTPYTEQRLDSLAGYEAGMPNPGFYRRVWKDRSAGRAVHIDALLQEAVFYLRKRGQHISSADLIAVKTSAQALAALRGHTQAWRTDLIDAIIGSFIKEAIEPGTGHPLLDAVFLVLRGDQRGKLAEGSRLAPLVVQINQLLEELDLIPQPGMREQELDLLKADDLLRSRCLHGLRILGIPGFTRLAGTDFTHRDDLSRVWERWRLSWSPDYDAACIEAAIYGSSLQQAASARLTERAQQQQRSSEQAALLLLDASLMGAEQHSQEFLQQLITLIRADSDFVSVGNALGHVLYLYSYDEALGTARRDDIGLLLRECYDRALWLLSSAGLVSGQERSLLQAVRTLVHSYQQCGSLLQLDHSSLIDTLLRVAVTRKQEALLRGAATGALWAVGFEEDRQPQQVYQHMRLSAAPEQLGDFLTGLFALAREQAQRHPQLLQILDTLLLDYTADEFLEALPALRLAFSFFTPREKHYMAQSLMADSEVIEPLTSLAVDPITAARALAIEERMFSALKRYGIRSSPHEQ